MRDLFKVAIILMPFWVVLTLCGIYAGWWLAGSILAGVIAVGGWTYLTVKLLE